MGIEPFAFSLVRFEPHRAAPGNRTPCLPLTRGMLCHMS